MLKASLAAVGNAMLTILGSAAGLLFLAYGIIQIYAAFLGIEHYWGAGAAITMVVLALFTQITFPITIGAFFGARDVWDWHWAIAVLFVAPGLVFLIPGAVVVIFHRLRSSRSV